MTVLRAKPEQIFEGTEIGDGGTIECDRTGDTLREGDNVVVACSRVGGSEAWTLVGVFHPPMAPKTVERAADLDADAMVNGAAVLVYGRLAVASDQATQQARLVLCDADLMDHAEL